MKVFKDGHMSLFILAILLSALFINASYAQEQTKQEKSKQEQLNMTEGEFAVKLINDLKWENYLPVAADVEDYIKVLETFAVAPLEGWDSGRQLTAENRMEIVATMSGYEKLLYEKAIKACNYNVNLMNTAQQVDGGKRSAEEVARDKKYFPKGPPKCPWSMPYRFVKGKALYHYHLAPMLSYQDKEKVASAFTKETRKDSKFRAKLAVLADQDYETNVFFAYGRTQKDYKVMLKPLVDLAYADKDIFVNAVNYAEWAEYTGLASWTFDNDLMTRVSYYPTDTASWGVRNRLTSARKSQLGTVEGVARILALGYYNNVLDAGFKFSLPKNFTTSFGYAMEHVDFTSAAYRDGPNKRTNKFLITESYRVSSQLFPYASYYNKLIDFTYMKNKDGALNGFTLGVNFKLPRLANINAEGAFEMKGFSGANMLITKPRTHGFVYGAKIESTFSQSTQLYLEFSHRPLTEASGTDYRHFSSYYVGGRVSQRLPYLMTMSLGGTIESQYFRERDSFLTIPGDRLIVTSNYDAELRKSLTADVWLSLRYKYLSRDSGFAQNSYLDNITTASIGSRF